MGIIKYTVFYKIDDVSSYDITSDTFRNNKKWVWYLYQWRRIWSVYGTVQPYVRNLNGIQHKIESFGIYITDTLYFDANMEGFNMDGENASSNDINDNSYLAAIFAAYIATYSCGICTTHFEYDNDTPRIITSMARYHLYYTMKRFIRTPGEMSKYITSDICTIINRNRIDRYVWTDEFHQGQENLSWWVNQQPRGTIRNAKHVMSSRAGQVGIKYQKRGKLAVMDYIDDYKMFIATKTNGLTKIGQLLLQQSIESYVYCILGAQASTRWPIVGRGAMSLQTQSVFLTKVKETIIQDDKVLSIRNMRKAIVDTNVILNMAISPGIILVPSNMIILTEMIPGYNNILTLVGKGMKFGENDAVNYLNTGTEGTSAKKPQISAEKSDKAEPEGSTTIVPDRSNNTYTTDLYILITTLVGGILMSRYVI